MKIECEKKLSALQSQEYKGEDETKLDKTKASINKLKSLRIVTSQAVSTTSTAIIGLRDSDLVPQLVELCHGYVSALFISSNDVHGLWDDANTVKTSLGCGNKITDGHGFNNRNCQRTEKVSGSQILRFLLDRLKVRFLKPWS